ncbi:hypothetical protein V8C35DRAFT_330741 [Trichoderma chlorosporum]
MGVSYTPNQLLLDLDNIGITRLRHYKRNANWFHEFVRADIKLKTSGPAMQMSALIDHITFRSEEEADEYVKNELEAFELSEIGMDLDRRFFSLAILGFILERHSSKYPAYDIRSRMCYWYAGSSLDCLSFVLNKARREVSFLSTSTLNHENSNRAGTFKLLRWDIPWFKRELSDSIREPEPSSAPQTVQSSITLITKDAELNAQRFKVCNMLGLRIKELCEKSPEEQDNILRQHLMMENPITITKRKDGYLLHPTQLPAYLLLQESIIDEETTQPSTEEARTDVAPAALANALVRKAREQFYGQNKFLVVLEALPLFFCDRSWAYKVQNNIAPLIRNMAAIIIAPESTDEPTVQSDDDAQQYKLYRDDKRVSQEWIQKRLDILKDVDEQAKIEVLLLAGRGEQGWPAINCLRQDVAPKLVELGKRFSQLRIQECVCDDGSEWNI